MLEQPIDSKIEIPPDFSPPVKRQIGTRVVFALAFAALGAKLGYLGALADSAAALRGEPHKLQAIVKGGLVHKMKTQLSEEIASHLSQDAGNSIPTMVKAVALGIRKVAKFAVVTMAAGMVTGAIIGWVRGDKVKKASDIVHHPITSVKLVLGLEHAESEADPANKKTPEVLSVSESLPTLEPQESNAQWRARAIADRQIASVQSPNGLF